MFIYWIDTDNSTIQLDPKSNFANKNSNNFDIASNNSFREDVRSLSDGSISYKSLPIEGSEVIKAESKEETPILEADIMEVLREDLFYSFKKKFKKFKIAANRAIFK